MSGTGLKQVLSGNLFEQNLFDIRYFSCRHLDSLSICECKDGQKSDLKHGARYVLRQGCSMEYHQ